MVVFRWAARLAVAGAWAWVAAACAAEPALPVRFQHQDWQLACDNTRTCRAAGSQRESDDVAVSILLTRQAGPRQPVRAQFALGSYGDQAPRPEGQRMRFTVGARAFAVEVDNDFGELPADATAALLAGLQRRDAIALQSGRNRWRVSGDGAAAVLLKMDAVQGRTGTQGALVRKGSADESAVPAALPVPVVRAAPVPAGGPDAALAARLLAGVPRAEGCDDTPREPPAAWQLGRDMVLVQIFCRLAAYNFGYAYWLVPANAPQTARLVTDFGSEYDGAGSIRATHKGRGLGDCTSTDEWTWDGRGFVHTASTFSGPCNRVAAGGAWDMPTLITTVTASSEDAK